MQIKLMISGECKSFSKASHRYELWAVSEHWAPSSNYFYF